MKLVMTLLCRNEADIIAANIDFHLQQGVDFVIAMDNGSEDETVDILKRYQRAGSLRLIHQEEDDYNQDIWVTGMARMAKTEHGADWIINNDADEFWWPRAGNLKSVLSSVPPDVEAVVVPRTEFVPICNEAGPFYARMVLRQTVAYNAKGLPLPPKTCHRGYGDVVVAMGNHGASRPSAKLKAADTQHIEILHYPVRSFRQFAAKIEKGGAALRRNNRLKPTVIARWRQLYVVQQAGELEAYYAGQCSGPERLASGLASGRLTLDLRLARYFQAERGSPGSAVAAPSAPAARDAAAEIAPAPFIVGVARSGTTLLRLMLDRHPDLAIPPETHFLPRLIALWDGADPVTAQAVGAAVGGHFAFGSLGISIEELEAELVHLAPFTLPGTIRALYRLYARRLGKTRWGDKTPPYLGAIGMIALCLPEAHILHIIRDGRAMAASRSQLKFGPGADMAAQARDWRDKILQARRQKALCPNYLELRYEELVAEPERVLRQVCAFLRLPFEDDMLRFHETAAERLEESRDWRDGQGKLRSAGAERQAIHAMTHHAPDPSRIDAWRGQLSAAEVAAFEAEAGDLLCELGYPLQTDPADERRAPPP